RSPRQRRALCQENDKSKTAQAAERRSQQTAGRRAPRWRRLRQRPHPRPAPPQHARMGGSRRALNRNGGGAAITIDETARFVSLVSFELGSGDVSPASHEVQRAVERQVSSKQGFIGCIVMVNRDKPHLIVMSVWESGDAWSAAQYDQEIGRVVS